MSDIPNISLTDLTEASLKGNGVFDVLMRASKAHLDEEFTRNRIKGAEYAQVYLGSLTQILETATQFLLEKDRSALQAKLIEAQVKLAEQQALNAIIEGQNLVLQGEVLKQQGLNLEAERDNLVSEKALKEQQVRNLAAEELNIPKQGKLLDAQQAQLVQQTALGKQQTLNAEVEGRVMEATICKLKAEYDLIMEQKLKTVSESALLAQKKVTEQAQTSGTGVDTDSVIGKQKLLYSAQTDGFKRDAEQKAAKLMVDTWNVRRTTDEGTIADSTNMLNDAAVGRAVRKLLDGVQA